MTSNLWAAKLYYEIPLLKGKLNIGTEDSYTSNEQGYTMLNEIISSYIPSSKDESRQQNYAAYATYAKNWNAFSVQVGLRWEFVKFEYKHNRIQDDEISRTDNNLSPNISLSYNFDDKTFVALDYAHTITRPP
jgi:outer membrane receptor protein involved in Fe transport